MNKKGTAYEIAWQFMLAPLKLLFIVLVALLGAVVFYSISLGREEVNLDETESFEIKNAVLNCLTLNSKVVSSNLNFESLRECIGADVYGVHITSTGKDIVVNDRIYSTYKGLCGRNAICDFFTYTDLDGNELNAEIVFKK